MKQADNKIYLASKSPRRRELLRQIGIDFELLLNETDVDESVLAGENALDYVARVTRDKLQSAFQTMLLRQLPHRPILSADTTVVIDHLILGKPADHAEAVDMIRRLSGRTHQVLTSVAVGMQDPLDLQAQVWQITQQSDVTFEALSDAAVEAYCNTLEPYDKAGAYGIQGLASMFIQNIVGSHSGIMGLPLYETAQLLQKAGIRIL
ncbi:Maf family protein [Herbaspirillum lusitanum]|uniref:dTTP/UTP pyrophosphatase n=1 Tax=Herbaspirillum lusitanum TaxID=213312 RepID=A0ABW9A3P7_9BURK